MSTDPAPRPPAYQTLAEDLRAQITSGRLRPGQRLPTEPQLCARSGLSRSTVREALRMLASQHLIVTTRGVSGGSFVAQPSPERLSDNLAGALRLMRSASIVGMAELLEVREMLEVPAAGLAARRRTDADLAALSAALFDPVADDLTTLVSRYREFHLAVLAAVHNPLYLLMARSLHNVLNDRELGAAASVQLRRQGAAAHREILRCIAEQDADGAEEAARGHLRDVREFFLPAMAVQAAPAR
ncbi:MAG TPA: FCD domain-containing protein [Pilimelia sp.]|nr:FCD domain-containing protein [Pilimelia sp.]